MFNFGILVRGIESKCLISLDSLTPARKQSIDGAKPPGTGKQKEEAENGPERTASKKPGGHQGPGNQPQISFESIHITAHDFPFVVLNLFPGNALALGLVNTGLRS